MKLPRTLIAGVLGLSASIASASTTAIVSHYQDLGISVDGTNNHVSDKLTRVGNRSNLAQITAAVYVFELPELQVGQSIIDAVFAVGLDRTRNGPQFDVDLYGLGYRSAATVNVTDDYYAGAFDEDPNAVGLQSGFLTPDIAVGGEIYESVNLASYLNELYQAGAQAGDYVFLRLNPNVTSAGNYVSYEVAMSTYETVEMRPTLYVTVPEPSTTAGLFGVAALGLVVVRRRFMKR